ncbi:MAG: class I SAM-dependent methyltransferase, partial [Chloroflexi bacterium]|nr:class I SAM-dependent methyltransferase [Chloroflexota bacterium]
CGAGHAINLMAREFPKSRFVGYDFSEKGIKAARAESSRLKLRNAEFVVQDVSKLNIADRYDLITVFDAIHDQAHPRKVLASIHRALKPGGVFLMVDVAGSSNVEENLDHPLAPFLYTASVMHCMTVSLALNGEGLGTMWGEQKARELLNEAGFKQISVKRLEGDIINNYYITRKG